MDQQREAAGAPEVPPVRDPLLAAVAEITARSYPGASSDAAVSAVVGGDQRVQRVDISRTDLPAGILGARIAEAVGQALALARTETVRAMAELPGLGEQLQRLSGGERA